MLTSRTVQDPFLFNVQEQTMMDSHSVCFTDRLVLNGLRDIHTWKQKAIKGGK